MKVSLRLLASVLCLTFLAGASLAFGATPVLVRDIDPRPLQEQGSAEQLVSVGDRVVFFLGPDNAFPDHARLRELWTTDGTASGTERLRSFSDDLRSLGSNGRIAFFAVQSADFVSWQLWRTDGTAAGTFSFNVTVPTPHLPSIRTFYRDRLFFDGCTPQGGCELWASDGTAAGTRQVRDLTPGPASSRPHSFATAGGRLYFFADDPTGPALWTSDGSSDGTHRVVTLPPFSRSMDPVAAGDRIFFLEGVPFHSTLWTSDGTASGTRTVPPFDHAGNRRPEVDSILGSLGGSLFFAGLDRFNSYQLWKTDGTPRGTLRLTSSPPVPPGVTLLPTGGAALGDRFVFEGVDFRLWTTRGTRASTQRLAGCPGGCPLALLSAVSLVHDGKLFFTGSTPGSGTEPWVTDGTAAGTRRLGDFCPDSCGSDANFVAVVLGRAFFTEGPRLWTTDGTVAGTALLNDGGFTGELAAAGNRTVFTTFSDAGPGLAVTDGTTAGTQSLDVHFGHGAGSNPRLFLPIGNEVRFQTCDIAPAQVWTSDGTAGGTFPLTGETISSYCAPLAKLGSAVYFIGVDQEQSFEVWRSDGAPGDAFPITRLAPDRMILSLGAAGDRLVLFVQEVASGTTELWTSDGTEVGTVKVTDLPDLAPSFIAASPGGRPGEFFFQATDAEGVNTFWFSDGTAGGTRRLIGFFSPDLTFTGFTRFNGAVYFAAGNAGLWRTDGTAAGTRQVLQDAITEIVPFAGSLFLFDQSAQTLLRSDGSAAGTNFIADLSDAQSLNPVDPRPTVAGGVLYFVSIDADHGAELWRTDGTRAGNRIVADISPGTGSSSPAGLTAAGGLLYFTANDGEHGRELWVTDGTEAGTRMVADIASGPGSSSPIELTVAGDHLFFNADDGFTGRELWLLPLGPNN